MAGDYPHDGTFFGYTFVYPRDTLPRVAMKDAGLRIRVERTLRDEFLEICRSDDKPAAQVIREFMREYVSRGRAKVQPNLFARRASTKEGKR